MLEKGACKDALKEKVCLYSFCSSVSLRFTARRLEWKMKKKLMIGTGDYEIGRKARRPEETK
jgi:hypothetical protein